jgi:hypothetical protein
VLVRLNPDDTVASVRSRPDATDPGRDRAAYVERRPDMVARITAIAARR